jgi:hypothetical protein
MNPHLRQIHPVFTASHKSTVDDQNADDHWFAAYGEISDCNTDGNTEDFDVLVSLILGRFA